MLAGPQCGYNAVFVENPAVDGIDLDVSNPDWPHQFSAEVVRLRSVLFPVAGNVRFEHIGSTAVPGLIAKPIVDILLIPIDGSWPRDILLRELPTLEYVFWDANPDPQHLFFVKGMPPFGSGRTHHVHVRPPAQAQPILVFRDQLRSNAKTARAYAELKLTLAAKYPKDREAYTRGKDEFIARILRRR